ncbi:MULTISPECIES: LysR family transcriptional regulator [unclassified Pseudovibrio]|uniref:LysR family transcriptional regulator n=1 Tax=unclassified Pseudovibrio TaxID=2627060 RepID=UPI0007AE8EA2|nr:MULTISPECIES: LysR family transcriptional regulator [unclassified Pseudovibrio]KZL03590.1 HTH-type transcriptional regulator DmlR [Pseudovibrio sp. W74]KZL09696.1 HTH-type transcriptional regulator DmlR [Pseudovibrio sp. Ad14]
MDKLETMQVFVEVAERESFVEASKKLGLSAPAVTRSIARLEQSLGTRLFNRTTRHVRLTDAGRHYLCDVKGILESVEQAEAFVSGSYAKPIGELSITAPILFGQKYIIPLITEYLDLYPEVTANAEFYDRIVNMVEDNLDVAFRIGHLQDSGLYATRVGSIRRVICASPAYFSVHGTPQTPSDLAEHKIIQPTSVETSNHWKFAGEKAEVVKINPHLRCNHNCAAIQAATGGAGITRLLSYQVAKDVSNGVLQLALEDYEPEPLPVHIVYMEGRRASAKVRSFVDFAAERLRDNPFIGD